MESRSVNLPVKAQKKHVVLLILSGVLLLISLSGAWDLVEFLLLPEASSPPADEGMEMGLSVALLGVVLEGFALFVLLVAVIPCWCMGTVLTVLLAMSKHDKPKWLWAASLGLAVAFGLIAAGTLAAWIFL